MATPAKQILIDGMHVGYATSAEVKAEYETSDPTPTFDGNVPGESTDTTYTVSIEKLRYGTSAEYTALTSLLMAMEKTPKTITIIERKKFIDGNMRVTQNISKCTITNNNPKMSTDSYTVESLEFKGTALREWHNGKEVKPSA